MHDEKPIVSTSTFAAAIAYQRAHAAKRDADAVDHNALRELRMDLDKAYGEGCEITHEPCRSKFGRHIYTPATHHGVGHRKCIFCGAQNFED